ncbi:MAG: o-succinylbenzoate synthase, partial [Chloroflexota bacterium]|nr:o-succinylbenzoate synthase [Chloroflexota bacterium]
MLLAEISIHLLSLRLRVPFTTSFGTYRTLSRPFVVLRTADGATGVGEIPTLVDPAYKAECDTPAVLTSLREFIVPSVDRYQAAHGPIATIAAMRASYAWVKGAVFAKSGLEAALWDVLAQQAGEPLWRLWEGERRTFPVGVSIGGQTVEQVLNLAGQAVDQGYRRLKIKIWPGFDLAVIAAVRARHPDLLLQADANSA